MLAGANRGTGSASTATRDRRVMRWHPPTATTADRGFVPDPGGTAIRANTQSQPARRAVRPFAPRRPGGRALHSTIVMLAQHRARYLPNPAAAPRDAKPHRVEPHSTVRSQ